MATNDVRVVAVLNHDLMAALAGDSIHVSTMDGEEVVLRLLTSQEFIEQQHALIDSQKYPGGTKVTRTKAEELTQPLDLFRLAGRS